MYFWPAPAKILQKIRRIHPKTHRQVRKIHQRMQVEMTARQLMNRRNQIVQMVQMTVQTVLHRKKTTSARFPLNVLLFWITGMI